jgi:predicted transcriptional regulator
LSIKLTDREAQVMEILWRRGPSTVSEVREALADELAYTTVLTILRTLEAKHYVGHDPEGRTHRYSASIELDTARLSAARALVEKLFKGSTELLLTHLVTNETLSDSEIKRIRRLLEERSKKKG